MTTKPKKARTGAAHSGHDAPTPQPSGGNTRPRRGRAGNGRVGRADGQPRRDRRADRGRRWR
jgi:hypothetical protein